jgi:hypothetical protein
MSELNVLLNPHADRTPPSAISRAMANAVRKDANRKTGGARPFFMVETATPRWVGVWVARLEYDARRERGSGRSR